MTFEPFPDSRPTGHKHNTALISHYKTATYNRMALHFQSDDDASDLCANLKSTEQERFDAHHRILSRQRQCCHASYFDEMLHVAYLDLDILQLKLKLQLRASVDGACGELDPYNYFVGSADDHNVWSRKHGIWATIGLWKRLIASFQDIDSDNPILKHYLKAWAGALHRRELDNPLIPYRNRLDDPFRRKLVNQYCALPPSQTGSHDEWTWCPVLGDYRWGKHWISRHYIFPAKHGQSAMTAIFGPSARLHSARNGVLIEKWLGSSFEQGAWTIVPDVEDLGDMNAVKKWRAQKVKSYKAFVIHPEVLGKRYSNSPSQAQFLENRKLQFQTDLRPRARYFAYHFLYCVLKVKLNRIEPTEQLEKISRGTSIAFWAGLYLKDSQLKALCRFMGGLAEQVFTKCLDIGADDSDMEEEQAGGKGSHGEANLMVQTILFDIAIDDRDPVLEKQGHEDEEIDALVDDDLAADSWAADARLDHAVLEQRDETQKSETKQSPCVGAKAASEHGAGTCTGDLSSGFEFVKSARSVSADSDSDESVSENCTLREK